ncbi:auxin-responsive protein SAUR19-like [Alnus glutinosa]|uniref:auxin-responsive protein SAUR19-like n=1 Tax=Alnus glutinosa TaxID=3517 RepID=UPI002D77C9E3|nr:auxin-responsive protein SAUR19-like [Alnus glutinosa]
MAKIRERLGWVKAKLGLKYCSRDSDAMIIEKKEEEKLVPSGFLLSVDVDEERRRYMVPITYLSSTMFQALLNQFEEEILAQRKGPITLSCSTQMFEWVRDLVAAEKRDCSTTHA